MYWQCEKGRWILGHLIDGTQAEYVRIPFADNSLYHIPEGSDVEAVVMLSDILPTGFECGVLNGRVQSGNTVAIVEAGPVGLAALLTAQFYFPAQIIMFDPDDNRLQTAQKKAEWLLSTIRYISSNNPWVFCTLFGMQIVLSKISSDLARFLRGFAKRLSQPER